MKKLYEKSELWFALLWIFLYCLAEFLANPLSNLIGIDSSAHAILNLLLSTVLLIWVWKNGLTKKYGLCAPCAPAGNFLWYVPLLVLATCNFWNGFAVNLPALDTLCYLCSMLCVGFLEEIIFRGFLFQAIRKSSLKQAVVISSVTFGLGHFLHLVDGSGMQLWDNIIQVVLAIAIGFLFVMIFYHGGSLLPCILTHSAIDMASAFANLADLTLQRHIFFSSIELLVVILYTVFLLIGGKKTSRHEMP